MAWNPLRTNQGGRTVRNWRIFAVCAGLLGLAVASVRVSVATEEQSEEAELAVARRNWEAHPAVAQSDTAEEIYALGDIHGDYQRATALLKTHHLLAELPAQPEHARWSGGRATLVCTGDYIDKWTEGLQVLALLQALQASAREHGGHVILLLGNHEAEFLANPAGSKTSEFASELVAAGINPTDVASGKHPLGVFLRNLPMAARVRDWFFSHAGNTAGRPLKALKHDLESGVDADGFGAAVLSANDSILEAKLGSGAWWETTGDPQGTLTAYTKALGVGHLVLGHQPGSYDFIDGGGSRTAGTLFQAFGMVFLIDAGMSQGVDDSQGALLRITGRGTTERAQVLAADGSVTQLWHR